MTSAFRVEVYSASERTKANRSVERKVTFWYQCVKINTVVMVSPHDLSPMPNPEDMEGDAKYRTLESVMDHSCYF